MLYMSNISSSGPITPSGSLTPSCPHCINLNRFRPFYSHVPTDHFLRETRDRNSPVVCPMLKNVECSSCGFKGHTQSHCTNYHKKKQINKSVPVEEVITENRKSRFDILFESDESDDDESGPFRPRSPDYPPP